LSVRRRHAPAGGIGSTRLPAVDDEPYLVAVDRDGLRREAIVERIVAAGSGMPMLMPTAADRRGAGGCGNQVGRSGRHPIHPLPPGAPFEALWVMPAVKAARCCRHVSGFRYADDMPRLVASSTCACVERLGEPGIIATVPGAGYRIDTERSLSERADDTAPEAGPEGGDRG
jgi:hypothetical protein